MRIDIDQIHQRQVAAETFIAADSFVVGEEVSAAIKNEAAFEDLDSLHMMRRMAMHDRDTFFDQTMRERDLFRWDAITPVTAPVDRRDQEIAWLLKLSHLTRDSRGSCF